MTTPMMTMTPQHSASDEGRHRQLACRQSSDDEDPGREVNVVTTHKKRPRARALFMSRACFGYSTDTEQWPIELNLDRSINRCLFRSFWWAHKDSNLRPAD